MNNDTIKLQEIKGYTMLLDDMQELIYKYNKAHNNNKISDETHEAICNQLTIFKTELINYITLVANK